MSNPYLKTKFLLSVNYQKQLPFSDLEVAFAGRSNAGKSSALNVLTAQKNLAKVSKTPGRTQLINFFTVEENKFLVDLPGYGYAKVPEEIKAHWQNLLGNYLLKREQLRAVVLLMDIRHPMKNLDIELLECCAERELPCHILLTKADKLSRSNAIKALRELEAELKNWNADFSAQIFSSLTRQGLEELIEKLNSWFFASEELAVSS